MVKRLAGSCSSDVVLRHYGLLLFLAAVLCLFPNYVRSQSVILEWDPNSEQDLAGYHIYRSNRPGIGYARLNTQLLTSTTFTDSTILPGQTYYYVCTAENDSGMESTHSNEVSHYEPHTNVPPTAVDDTATLAEDTFGVISVLANDQDPDQNPLSVSAVTQGQAGTVINNGDSVTYTPNLNFFGTDSFDYTVIDGQGGSDSGSVVVSVLPINDPPTAADDAGSLAEDTTTVINVINNDTDIDGGPLALVSVGVPGHGTAIITTSTSVRYTPHSDYNGLDSFVYTVGDGQGGRDAATVEIMVTPVNDVPQAADDFTQTPPNQAVTVDVLNNDIDRDQDALSVTSAGPASRGAVVVNPDQTITYTPELDYRGSDSFSYTISDGNGGIDTGRVAVMVNFSNKPPEANDDVVVTQEDVEVVIPVTQNDTDLDDDPLTVMRVSKPTHGSAVIESPSTVRYVPDLDYFGTDSFRYVLGDDTGQTDSADVLVTITPVNDPPSPRPDSAGVQKGSSILIDVLQNDDDPDDDVLTIASLSAASHGENVIEMEKIRYTPDPGFIGRDWFDYSVTDGTDTRHARVLVDVTDSGATLNALVFPTTIDTGAPRLANTYVGVGIVNPGDVSEVISCRTLDRSGRLVARSQIAEPLPPKGQMAFLTQEVEGFTPESVALAVEGEVGPVQGFFMVGDFAARRMDGVGAQLDGGEDLYFTQVHENEETSTLIQIINLSDERTANTKLELFRADGTLVATVWPPIELGGSFMGTVREIFTDNIRTDEGFIKVTSNVPVSGYEVVVEERSFMSSSARRSRAVKKLVAPHFFWDSQGGTSILRVLNAGAEVATARIRVYGDGGTLLASVVRVLPRGVLQVFSASELMDGALAGDLVSGFVELEVLGDGKAEILASMTFRGFGGRSSATVPMLADGLEETLFPQVAQAEDGSIFTGLAIVNGADQIALITVEAYREDGEMAQSRTFELKPGARVVDLLRSDRFFGPGFTQVKGHLRVRGSGPVFAYALFGDAEGQFLSTIEGQAVRVE